MNKFISKTTYIEYLKCPKNAWLKLHKKHELQDLFTPSEAEQKLFDKGNDTESFAQKFFPNSILIEINGVEAASLTASHIEQKTPVLFQATFIHDKFLVRNDVLQYNKETKKWNLYEVKANNSLKENTNEIDHVEDATFQAIVLKEQGIELENIFIVHLNENYIRTDDIEIEELFVFNNITDKVKEREQQTKQRMQEAKTDLLKNEEEALICSCIYKGRSAHCKTFSYSHAHVPSPSVHDIARITPKKLTPLIDSNILNINDIPDDFELTNIQKSQVNAYKSKITTFNSAAIKQELNKLTYPLYFLDYESYSHPIPLFKGFKPWQQVPFQFSLQIVADKNSAPINFEYLHEFNSDPSEIIIQKLTELIGSTGSIIVWRKSFEKIINNELGERHPEHKVFLESLNDRLFDLEEIFTKQLYIDAKFNGKTSIKNVLPALIPELSYDQLTIQSGEIAPGRWFNMITTNITESEKSVIANDLKRYCNLDTYGMYKIWQFLSSI